MKPVVILLVLVASMIAVAQEAPQPMPPASRFMAACLAQGAALNVTSAQCESFMVRSRLIQSDALRYLATLGEKQRDTFATLSTQDRFNAVETHADMTRLVSVVLKEVGTEGLVVAAPDSRVAAHIVGDVMKSSCGPYQLDTIVRTVDDVIRGSGDEWVRAKRPWAGKQAPQKTGVACMVPNESASTVEEDLTRCLSVIFQLGDQSQRTASAISEPSPNP